MKDRIRRHLLSVRRAIFSRRSTTNLFLALCIGVTGLAIMGLALLALEPSGPVTIGPLKATRPESQRAAPPLE